MSNLEPYAITTDTCSDLPVSYLEENNIGLMSLSFTVNGQTYREADRLMEPQAFYQLLRNEATAQTSQVGPAEAERLFESYLKQGLNVLHIAFSSALSGSYNSAALAAKELAEKYPERRIIVIDSLCASLGEGLLVHKAVELKKSGETLDAVSQWVEDNKLKLCHYFTVDNLFHLYRGGRITKTTALVGSMLGIKPVLKVDDEGRLIQYAKVRGRKHSLTMLVDDMEKSFDRTEKIAFISHGDCLEDAEYVAGLIRERMGIDHILINYVGPTIGSHSGPGTVALFFFGAKR